MAAHFALECAFPLGHQEQAKAIDFATKQSKKE